MSIARKVERGKVSTCTPWQIEPKLKAVGGRFKREEPYICLWLIHVDIWQKPIQCCKAIILQLKKKLEKRITCGSVDGRV